jgi:hypothetical protein
MHGRNRVKHSEVRSRGPNQPTAGNAGIALLFAIRHRWPGLPEPGLGLARAP